MYAWGFFMIKEGKKKNKEKKGEGTGEGENT